MNLQPIASLDDPRVAAYRNLKDRDVAAEGDRFIAEGEHVVRRMLASDFPVESLLLAERRVAEIGGFGAGGGADICGAGRVAGRHCGVQVSLGGAGLRTPEGQPDFGRDSGAALGRPDQFCDVGYSEDRARRARLCG